MSESFGINFLYNTSFGRFILKGFVNPTISKYAGKVLSSSFSRHIIPFFIKKNNIDINEYEIAPKGFKSFNDFFIRKIKSNYRIIEKSAIISPCDGLLTVSNINNDSVFFIKNTRYSLSQLLRDEKFAKEFIGGTALVFRLTPAHYHRYSFCVSGVINYSKQIKGILHSVRPICHEKFPVFIENSREYVVIENEFLGKIVQMEVGALLVGKITNYSFDGRKKINQGIEKGYFEYGGSSIVILSKIKLDLSNFKNHIVCTNEEISVKLGEALTIFK